MRIYRQALQPEIRHLVNGFQGLLRAADTSRGRGRQPRRAPARCRARPAGLRREREPATGRNHPFSVFLRRPTTDQGRVARGNLTPGLPRNGA